ncbi:MAG: ABC-F family ATP-binding cassette domain-containing protein [Candidatus Obscuribacterales bacterium]|jgi:ATP-binding cassette subfamily F protein 3
MLRLENISKIYPQGEVLTDVTWELKQGDRIGLVGPNGGGKSTQFKIITGEIEPTSGQIIRQAGLQVGYLNQEFAVTPTNTVREEFSSSFVELNTIHHALTAVHTALETATPEELDKLLKKMDNLQREYEAKGGYAQESKVEKMMAEMGFALGDGDRFVSEFSGGWQMRMNLGKVLLQKPDILLLDEPTNHIDMRTIEWLETFLRDLSTPMAIISHDRHFLDRLCTSIVEMERGQSSTYLGNYSTYQLQKEQNRDAQQAAYDRQVKEMEVQQRFVDRFRASATRSTQAKSREKQLDKIELIEKPEDGERTLVFHFPAAARSGREIVTIRDLTHGYNDNILFLDANLQIERGERIAILGPNGAGKSTLLRLITGREKPDGGSVKLGDHNVRPAYFEQNQAEALDLDKRVLDTIQDEVPLWKTEEVRALLGRFLFGGDSVFKKVESLSGGEKARLALAKMLLGANNFLILDEPTNHLDIPAKETLEDALKKFDGTVVVISHDRYFISQIATKIVEIRDGQLVVYHGNYNYYLELKEEERVRELEAKKAAEKAAEQAAKRAKELAKQKVKEEAKKGR